MSRRRSNLRLRTQMVTATERRKRRRRKRRTRRKLKTMMSKNLKVLLRALKILSKLQVSHRVKLHKSKGKTNLSSVMISLLIFPLNKPKK